MSTTSTSSSSLSSAARQIVATLLDFISQEACSSAEFESLALRLFAWQHASNQPYRRFCQRRGATPRSVKSWRDIPAVPISAFKEVALSCEPIAAAERIFMTSGTTRGGVKGRHYHPTLAVYDSSMRRNFQRRFMQDEDRVRMAILFPTEAELPNSSLAHYLALARREFGSDDSDYFLNLRGLETARLLPVVRSAERSGQPLALLGASYSFVHLMDELRQRKETLRLPPGSRILDTGGYKGQSRELPPEDFYATLSTTFGVAKDRCMNMYGMTELSTQFYDDGNVVSPSVKSGPHWVRSRVVDPLTGREVRSGEPGILAHCDLANFNSATTILTEDLAIACDGGFLLLGRAEGSHAKGCSLAVEEFLKAAAP